MSGTEIVLEDLLLILSAAALVAILVKRIRIPYTTALVLMGVAASFLPIGIDVHLSKELVLLIILPPLLSLANLVFLAPHNKLCTPYLLDLVQVASQLV